MFPILQIGPLAIQVPGLVLIAGLWLGVSLSERLLLESKTRVMSVQDVTNVTLVGLGIGILGARLGYILRFPTAFSSNPLDGVSLSPALLDPWFGLLAGVIAVGVYAQRRQLQAKLFADVFTPLLSVLAAAWAVSNLASGNGYGLPADLAWSTDFFGEPRHPAQIYDLMAAIVVLAIIWLRRKNYPIGKGILFFNFLALTSLSRLFLDAFHATGVLSPGGWRLAQSGAWITLAASLFFLRKNPKFPEQ